MLFTVFFLALFVGSVWLWEQGAAHRWLRPSIVALILLIVILWPER